MVLLAPSYKRWAKNPQLNALVRGVTAAATGAIAGGRACAGASVGLRSAHNTDVLHQHRIIVPVEDCRTDLDRMCRRCGFDPAAVASGLRREARVIEAHNVSPCGLHSGQRKDELRRKETRHNDPR